MLYKITLNMPSHSGNSVHLVFGEHPAETIADFMEEWRDQGYIIVHEHYKGNDRKLHPHADIALTDTLGAKVAYLTDE